MKIADYPVLPLFNVQCIRAIERQLFEQVDSFDVIKQAAHALQQHIHRYWSQAQRFVILVGGGNNGADGLLLASLLHQAGCHVSVIDCAHRARQGDALKAYQVAQQEGVAWLSFDKAKEAFASTFDSLVVVDALLGIGAKLPLKAAVCEHVHWINDARSQGSRVVCVDLPTGIDADTGFGEKGDFVQADLTVSMVQRKIGNVLGRGGIACGDLVNASLGAIAALHKPTMAWLEVDRLTTAPPCPRAKDSHKGTFGHIVVVGGDLGFGGAAIMASEAATKAGAGTVALLTRAEHVTSSLTRNPNVMALAWDNDPQAALPSRRNSVFVLGPGLGRSAWGQACFEYWVEQAKNESSPIVLDADGLFWLAKQNKITLPTECVLTPHRGEAARLLGWDIDEIERDPVAASASLAKRYQSIVVLKGTSSIIATPKGELYVTGKAAPVMAKGGSGDVLSGLLAACMAYYGDANVAALVAVAWHNSAAGACASVLGEHRAQPYDVLNYLD